jgi:hypothetical protein
MNVPESCADHREVGGEALTGASIGQPLSREKSLFPSSDVFYTTEGNSRRCVIASTCTLGVVARTWHVDTRFVREPGGLQLVQASGWRVVRIGKVGRRSR